MDEREFVISIKGTEGNEVQMYADELEAYLKNISEISFQVYKLTGRRIDPIRVILEPLIVLVRQIRCFSKIVLSCAIDGERFTDILLGNVVDPAFGRIPDCRLLIAKMYLPLPEKETVVRRSGQKKRFYAEAAPESS